MTSSDDISDLTVPTHIAVIMDGNGRWAKKRLLPKVFGHKKGATRAENVVRHAVKLGVKYITFYAFSSENWNRDKEEVTDIMGLFKWYLRHKAKVLDELDIRAVAVGDTSRLSKDIRDLSDELVEKSKDHKAITLQVCISYGGRDEIVQASRKLSEQVKAGTINADDIDEALFAKELYTGDAPDPDIIIRTSGEQRLSNFLLWQSAYSEFVFTDVLWPDFTEEHLEDAIRVYNNRDRRYGGRKE